MFVYKYNKLTKNQLEIVRQIKNSKLFNEIWYKDHYPDVVENNFHPITHYVLHGDTEGRDPSPQFNTNFYKKNAGIADDVNSLYHYITHPDNQEYVTESKLARIDQDVTRLKKSSLFDADYYLDTYPDVINAAVDPALHYLNNGWKEGRNPSKLFDTGFYLSRHPDIRQAGINPLIHFLLHGVHEGRQTSPAIFHQNLSKLPASLREDYLLVKSSNTFDPHFYLNKYPDVLNAGMDPLTHYLQFGSFENRDPSATFNNRYYKAQMTPDEVKTLNPLVHYIKIGQTQGYSTNALSQTIPQALATGHFFDVVAQPDAPGTIAVMAHMYYPELSDTFVRYLNNIPYPFDLLVSTDTADKAIILKNTFNKIDNLDTLNIKVLPNRGRDIAPMVIGFAKEMLEYDFALHLHSKKSPYGSALSGWLDYSLDNLLHSPVYISHLLDKLADKKKNIGALTALPFPEIVEHMHWESMLDYGKSTLTKLGIDNNILSRFELQFPAGSMFWFRPKAMAPLFSGKLSLEDFETEDSQMNATLAHVIERLFLYIAADSGYDFEVIRPASPFEGATPFLLSHQRDRGYQISHVDEPMVSIIVPVYNEWSYTADCLASILAFTNQDETPYEIILADDCSTDETINASNHFKNLIISRTPKNLGFSGNCNLGASKARGKYLLFLNNDTQVQPHWLSSLTSVYEKYPETLITGSKLIYADGSLQEAGGIVWENAGGANYGRNDDTPSKPEYCYIKPCDYISGAALMVTHEFWEKVGGFDKLFEPAYYEDTDLCMQARDNGGQVVLQPASQVVHFEGKSHGTDTGSGIKAYQVINKQNFFEKWEETLAREHTTGAHILNARERSIDKPVIAIIDYLLPEYDRHAGARHTFNYIELLLDKGYVVKYLACKVENLRQLQFARELEQMGIETFYPPALGVEYDWNNWLIGTKGYVDAVILNRPHVAASHVVTCQEHQIPMLYFVHDIHSLREYRQAINAGDTKLAELIKRNEPNEVKLIASMDFAFTPSEYEKQYLRDKYKLDNVGVLPLYISKDMNQIPTYNEAPTGHEVTFVGGMNHKPNQEAVIWLIESILPHISDNSIIINIVGPNPSDEIYKLSEKHHNVIIHGAVSDDELDAIYHRSRVIAIPLLSGAGVKGKVIEGFKNGIPIVSTAIGLEGIKNVASILSAYDEPELFAEQIATIMQMSDEQWLQASTNMQNFYRSNYSFDAGWLALLEGLNRISLSHQEEGL